MEIEKELLPRDIFIENQHTMLVQMALRKKMEDDRLRAERVKEHELLYFKYNETESK